MSGEIGNSIHGDHFAVAIVEHSGVAVLISQDEERIASKKRSHRDPLSGEGKGQLRAGKTFVASLHQGQQSPLLPA